MKVVQIAEAEVTLKNLQLSEIHSVEDKIGSIVVMKDGTKHFVEAGANLVLELLKEGAN